MDKRLISRTSEELVLINKKNIDNLIKNRWGFKPTLTKEDIQMTNKLCKRALH